MEIAKIDVKIDMIEQQEKEHKRLAFECEQQWQQMILERENYLKTLKTEVEKQEAEVTALPGILAMGRAKKCDSRIAFCWGDKESFLSCDECKGWFCDCAEDGHFDCSKCDRCLSANEETKNKMLKLMENDRKHIEQRKAKFETDKKEYQKAIMEVCLKKPSPVKSGGPYPVMLCPKCDAYSICPVKADSYDYWEKWVRRKWEDLKKNWEKLKETI